MGKVCVDIEQDLIQVIDVADQMRKAIDACRWWRLIRIALRIRVDLIVAKLPQEIGKHWSLEFVEQLRAQDFIEKGLEIVAAELGEYIGCRWRGWDRYDFLLLRNKIVIVL